jgi:hypothetical protein
LAVLFGEQFNSGILPISCDDVLVHGFMCMSALHMYGNP